MKRKSLKQREEELKNRREFARQIIPNKTAKEKDEYNAEREKHEEFDERQKDPERLNKFWGEFAKKIGVEPENLFIGPVPDEDELDRKATARLEKVIEERERQEPVYDVKKNDDGTVTCTINPELPRDLISHELNKILPPPSKKRFRKESIKALEVYNKWRKGQNKPLSYIARELNMPYSTAKTRWRRAYFLIHGEEYDYQKVKAERKPEADKLCAKCKDLKCYKESRNRDWIGCIEYVALAGKAYQREKTMTEKQAYYTHFGEVGDSDE